MRLIWVELQGYRRFEARSRMNVDSKLVAIVGPNEAGKSSFLKALQRLDDTEPFVGVGGEQELTRGAQIPVEQNIVNAGFLLEDEDREAVADVPGGMDIRWLIVSKKPAGSPLYVRMVPSPVKSLALREEVLESLRNVIDGGLLASREEAEEAEGAEEVDEKEGGELLLAVRSLAESLDEADVMPTKEILAQITAVGKSLEDDLYDEDPDSLKTLPRKLFELAEEEGKPHPEAVARRILFQRRPHFLYFSEEARTLEDQYNLEEMDQEVPLAIENLTRLANLDLKEVLNLIKTGDHGALDTLQEQANSRLRQVFSESWSQSKVVVRIRIDGMQLRVLVGGEGAPYVSIAERSDGLRQFVALLSFIALEEESDAPILLIDELETHLHYDAQADLVQMLARQEIARKVIYTTHSLGCLPEDLGTGVRLINPNGPSTSIVNDWFWEGGGSGFSPLLFGMGARTLSFVPIRYSLLTEGITDLLLFPSLLREATGLDALGFQVVPGLASASVDEVALLEHGAPRTAYLVDSDSAGKEILKKLKRAGINESRIFQLPQRGEDSLVVEDLLEPKIYFDAVSEELRRSFGPQPLPDLPNIGRPRAVEAWCKDQNISPPSKRAIAYRVLEMRAERSILGEEYVESLKSLYACIKRALTHDDRT